MLWYKYSSSVWMNGESKTAQASLFATTFPGHLHVIILVTTHSTPGSDLN